MDIVLRAAAAFVLIYVLLRVTGRRELSTLEPFDLILIVVIGDLVQQGVTQSDMSFTGLVLAVGTFTLLAVGTSWLSFRFKTMRRVLEAARLQQIASLDEVEWAIVEPGGQISIIPRASGT